MTAFVCQGGGGGGGCRGGNAKRRSVSFNNILDDGSVYCCASHLSTFFF